MGHRIRAIARAHRAKATLPSRDRAAHRQDRAATGRAPPAAPPSLQSRRGFRSSDRPYPGPRVYRLLGDSRRNARTAGAPAFPMLGRATRGLHKDRSRTPACSGSRRCPRRAAAIGRPTGAPDRNSATPKERDRDADSRSGSAQSGTRAATLIRCRHGRACPGHPRPCSGAT